ncbi:MAG: family 4 glycosyl hydrolase [Sedimentisphaerales bacterium]
MTKKLKISVIGAGSSTFSKLFIQNLCGTPNFEGSTICFMDVNEDRLKTVVLLCRRYADELGFKIDLHATTDRRVCIKDADFVVDLALILGHDGYRRGWAIAKKHGYRFGGSQHIMHDEAFWINYYQLKHFDEIAEDILELCPNAWFVMLANPVMAATTYLARKYKHLKFAGLCHGYAGVYDVVKTLGLKREYVNLQMSGVNHYLWLTDFTYKGENAFPILDKWISDGSAKKFWETCEASNYMGPKAIDLYKRYGVFPIGDTCHVGGGSWPFWYHNDATVEAKWKEDPTGWWEGTSGMADKWQEELDKAMADKNAKITEVCPPQKNDDKIICFMESLAFDIPRMIYVNIPNTHNYINGVPMDFEVELPAMVSKSGIQGIHPTALPKPVLARMLRDRVAPVEVELDAYQRGSKKGLVDLIMMDPWTNSEKQAEALLEDILNMKGCEQMKQYYK